MISAMTTRVEINGGFAAIDDDNDDDDDADKDQRDVEMSQNAPADQAQRHNESKSPSSFLSDLHIPWQYVSCDHGFRPGHSPWALKLTYQKRMSVMSVADPRALLNWAAAICSCSDTIHVSVC